ncbi:XRE family transcriptional regulator [Metabacillus sp. GX 13764]|uniref:helix-turn-helix domain-containing protein n=1 Tax=Metabacillus kandeliae TaxID=2900151 RepID=UPI001E39484C|nr:XRE family transcriptional regulator [Metabacillus kandeliae]MCD7034202.1 XRE family transcriptional regulator [Metabacillus kandeliae]
MEELNLIVAKNLKNYREKKKLSLEKVSELTGVSKTMIGQIERGESSPTISTVWKIANGLKISFTSLINRPQPEATLVLKKDVQVLSDDNGKYRVYPYFPFQDDKKFEMYSVEMEPEGSLESEAHREGTEEYITVYQGELTIMLNQDEYHLSQGDSIRFKADKPHTYHNKGEEMTRLNMMIYYLD